MDKVNAAMEARLYCARCRKRARYDGGSGLPAAMRRAVHKATGSEHCADGALIAPVDELPGRDEELREHAARLESCYRVTVDPRFGFLRADTLGAGDVRHWEGDDYDDVARQLPESLRRREAAR